MTLIIILLALLIFALVILLNVIIIRAICSYQAKQNAREFDYEYLAERIAEEICKRMLLIEKQKKEGESPFLKPTPEDKPVDEETK